MVEGGCGIELLDVKRLSASGDPVHSDLSQEDEAVFIKSDDKRSSRKNAPALKKELSLINGVAIVVGQIIGSGIFISPNIVLKQSGSFGLSISLWLFGAIVAIACGLSYCELGTFIKKCGGESAYILEAYSFKGKKPRFQFIGSLLAFLFTWASAFIIRPAAIAILTIVFGRYLCRPFYINCDIPVYIVKLIALALVFFLAAVNCYSVKLVGRIATIFTSVKLLSCAFIIIVGVRYVIARGCFPIAFHQPFEGTTHSPSNVAIALFGVLWAYNGWNMLGYASEEMKNVEKNLPRAVIVGVFLVVIVYIAINLAYFAVLSYEELLAAEAVALPFGKATIGTAGLVIIPLFVAVSTFGTANGNFYAGSRILLSSARDGLLLDALSGLHRTFKTPILGITTLSVISAILIVIGNIDDLLAAVSTAMWLFYGLAIAGLLIMRVTHKDKPRPYKVWLIAPIFGLLMCLYLVVLPVIQKPVPTLLAFGGVLLGVPVYVFLVMETPWQLRPKKFDRVSRSFSAFITALLNTQSSRSGRIQD